MSYSCSDLSEIVRIAQNELSESEKERAGADKDLQEASKYKQARHRIHT